MASHEVSVAETNVGGAAAPHQLYRKLYPWLHYGFSANSYHYNRHRYAFERRLSEQTLVRLYRMALLCCGWSAHAVAQLPQPKESGLWNSEEISEGAETQMLRKLQLKVFLLCINFSVMRLASQYFTEFVYIGKVQKPPGAAVGRPALTMSSESMLPSLPVMVPTPLVSESGDGLRKSRQPIRMACSRVGLPVSAVPPL